MKASEVAHLDLRQFMALRALADEGSVTGAARVLGYTQPAVSQQLAALERTLRTKLYEPRRGGARTTLTSAGERLLVHVRAVLARIEFAATEVATAQDQPRLHVGTIPSTGVHLLAPLLKRLARQAPDTEIRITESASDLVLLDLIERGRLDVAFAMLPLRDGPFRWTKLVDDPYVLAVGRRGRYAAVADATSIDALATTPVVEFLHSDNHIADWLRLHGLSYRVIHRSDDNGTVMALVAAGIGVAVVPWLTTSRRDDVRLRVLEDVPPRQLAITWHEARPTNAILDQFIRHAPAIATRLSHQIRREVPLT